MTQHPTPFAPAPASHAIQAELVAVLAAVSDGQPRIMTTAHGQALPSGPFTLTHQSLQQGLLAWVKSQTQQAIGYVEQLYTFADPARWYTEAPSPGQPVQPQEGAARSARHISISYLGLTREHLQAQSLNAATGPASWRNWYDYFPWEDQRSDWAKELLDTAILPALRDWVAAAPDAVLRAARQARLSGCFGADGPAQAGLVDWNEDLVLQRYELLYEAGLVAEARRHPPAAAASTSSAVGASAQRPALPGVAMQSDHRRILATGIARLRSKLKYRPVVFELMPAQFTLLQLQHAAEGITGRWLHKQNFRRLMEQQGLLEDTGLLETSKAGRPAKLFRFRSDITHERAIAGTKLPIASSAS